MAHRESSNPWPLRHVMITCFSWLSSRIGTGRGYLSRTRSCYVQKVARTCSLCGPYEGWWCSLCSWILAPVERPPTAIALAQFRILAHHTRTQSGYKNSQNSNQCAIFLDTFQIMWAFQIHIFKRSAAIKAVGMLVVLQESPNPWAWGHLMIT